MKVLTYRELESKEGLLPLLDQRAQVWNVEFSRVLFLNILLEELFFVVSINSFIGHP